MWLLFDFVYLLALPFLLPFLIWRRMRRGPGSLSLGERLGNVPSRPVASQCVWIHGVSLGEINATRTLVRDLHKLSPNTAIVISSTTRTGLDQARQLYPKLVTFRFPLDFSFVVARVLGRVRPSAIVLMELEVWPNIIELAGARGIPIIIANGRVTEEKSVRRFNHPLIRPIARRMFSKLTFVAAQEQVHADRFIALGVPRDRVEVIGSMKYDTAEIADHIEGQEQLAAGMTIDTARPLLVCGSTGPGEEIALIEAYARLRMRYPALQLAIIPRKPERFDEVARLIVERGFACLRRSGKPPLVPAGGAEPTPVFLGDTMGELRKFYSLATMVFVGRTLVELGGSDVMEVAALRKPIIVGPHTENFAEAVSILEQRRGIVRIASAEELDVAVGRLLGDAAERERIGAAAREAVQANTGATERTVRRVLSAIAK